MTKDEALKIALTALYRAYGESAHPDIERGIDVVVEALAQTSALDGWMPIASAPKDGTKILLCKKSLIADGFSVKYKGRDDYYFAWPYINADPTHWMPLPAAPKPE